MEQLSPEWFAARVGKATASRMADITEKTRSGWGAGRKNYMAELVAERLTGIKAQGYTNAAMQHGIDTEPEARAVYEFVTDCEVVEVGFVDHPTIPMTGASPDGLVGDVGMVEIKCPNTATHIETLLTGTVPQKYTLQMLWQMACTNRGWCDFVSYDPRMPESMQLFVKRIEWDAEAVTDLEQNVKDFLNELDETVAKLRGQYEPEEKAA
jgi:putative phage-type endonuclease